MGKDDKVEIYMNMKGTLRNHGEAPQNPVEATMGQFVYNFEETLRLVMTDKDFGMTELNPRIVIAMGISNIVLNMILQFKDVETEPKHALGMVDDLIKDVVTMCRNGVALIEAQKADTKIAH